MGGDCYSYCCCSYCCYCYSYCCYCRRLAGVGVDHDANGGHGGVHVREAEHDLLVVARRRAGALVAAVAHRAVRGGELAVVDELQSWWESGGTSRAGGE